MELMKKMLLKRGGFTLIEVLISLVIFAVGMLSFAGLEVLAIKNMAFSRDYAKANTYAQQKVEELKSKAWGDVSDPVKPDTLEGKFTRTWGVTTKGDIKELTVTVSWSEPSYGAKTVTFYTDLYSNPSY
jgi:type IV pilus assembly protein PilV